MFAENKREATHCSVRGEEDSSRHVPATKVHLLVILINCIHLINTRSVEHVKLAVTDLIKKLLSTQKRKANFGLQKSQLWGQCIATEVNLFRVNFINILINVNI
jgi:hypothetical protein